MSFSSTRRMSIKVSTVGDRLNDSFLLLFCEKNSDGTKKLRVKGRELKQRTGECLIDDDMIKIGLFINRHREINEINLSYNEIGDEGLRILSFFIFRHPNSIEHLNLMACDITEEGMMIFSKVSQRGFVKLKTLRLSGNKLGPGGGHATALVIENCLELEYLDVGDTDQDATSIDCLFLRLYCSQIKILNIGRVLPQHCYYQVDNTFLAIGISEFLRLNNTLVELHVQKCALISHDVETLLKGLKINSSLKMLDLGYNHLCCYGVELLAAWLRTRPNLLGLNVAGNKVGDHGALALSFDMPFSKLRLLDLSYNEITDKGMVAILNSIKKPFMLRYFFIWGNQFSHPTNKIIERMVRSTVFKQENIDVKIYCVDKVMYAARYPADHYKHRYYDIMDYGSAVELKIKRNRIEKEGDKPRALVNFKHVDRFPPLDESKF